MLKTEPKPPKAGSMLDHQKKFEDDLNSYAKNAVLTIDPSLAALEQKKKEEEASAKHINITSDETNDTTHTVVKDPTPDASASKEGSSPAPAA